MSFFIILSIKMNILARLAKQIRTNSKISVQICGHIYTHIMSRTKFEIKRDFTIIIGIAMLLAYSAVEIAVAMVRMEDDYVTSRSLFYSLQIISNQLFLISRPGLPPEKYD